MIALIIPLVYTQYRLQAILTCTIVLSISSSLPQRMAFADELADAMRKVDVNTLMLDHYQRQEIQQVNSLTYLFVSL